MNKIILIGRLVKENELTESKEKKVKILRNCIAVRRKGEEESDFINVTFLGKSAELVYDYTDKGNRIAIEGELHINNYEDDEGNYKSFTNVLVTSVDLIDFKEEEKKTKKTYKK